MSRTGLMCLGILVVATAARADEVTLKNGRKITGIAREDGDKVVVEIAIGTAAFPKSEVVSITPGRISYTLIPCSARRAA